MDIEEKDDFKENYIISSLVRGLKILSVFSVNHPELKISEIAELTGMNQSTVFRFIYTLEHAGYVVRDLETKKYHLSVRMLSLALPVRESIVLREVALPYMFDLSRRINETVKIAILDEVEIVMISATEVFDRMVHRTPIGHRSPAYCTALGKVLLAYQPIQEWDHLIGQIDFIPRTERTIVDPQKFREELMWIRTNGYSCQDSEYIPGLGSVAAPIFDHSGEIEAGINVSGLSVQIVEGKKLHPILTELLKTSQAISAGLGYDPGLRR